MEIDLIEKIISKINKNQITFENAFQEFYNKFPFEYSMDSLLIFAEHILYGSRNIFESQASVASVKFPVGTCGKQISEYDICYTCETCSVINNSAICSDCFKKELHIGHKYTMSTGGLGSCDCGDPSAIISAGFCPLHQGYKEELLNDKMLPEYVRKSHYEVIKQISIILNEKILKYQEFIIKKDYENKGIYEKEIIQIIEWFNELIQISPVFIKDLNEILNLRFYKIASYHTCLTFVSSLPAELEEHEKIFANKSKQNTEENNNKICQCRLLQLLINASRDFYYENSTKLYQFIIAISKTTKFRTSLCQAYITNYKKILITHKLSTCSHEDEFRKMSLQALSFDEIGLFFLQNPTLMQEWLKTLEMLMDMLLYKIPCEPEDLYFRMNTMAIDFHYIMKKKTTQFLVYKSNFLMRIIEIIKNTRCDLLQVPKITTHLQYMQKEPDINPVYHYTSRELMRIIRRILGCYDFMNDAELCYPLGVFFRKLIEENYQTCENNMKIENTYFYMNDIYKCFSIYLSFFINSKIANLFTENKPLLNLVLFKNELRLLFMKLLQFSTDAELDKFILKVLKISCKPLSFVLEILARRWVYYGEYASKFIQVYMTSRKATSFDLDFSLLQILISIYNGDELFENLVKILDNGNWLNLFFKTEKPVDMTEIGINNENIDKFMLQIDAFVYLVNSLFTNDACFYRAFLRLNIRSEIQSDFNKKIEIGLDKITTHYIRKTIIHTFMQNKNMISKYDDIIKKLPKKLRTNPKIEIIINEMCNKNIDAKGQTIFSLKNEVFDEFDPYFYGIPFNNNAEITENAAILFEKHGNELPKNTDLHIGRNLIDNANLLKYLPNLIKMNILRSATILKYIPQIFNNEKLPFILPESLKIPKNESLKISALKLISLFISNYDFLDTSQQNLFKNMVESNDFEIIKSMKILSEQSKLLKNTISNLLNKISEKINSIKPLISYERIESFKNEEELQRKQKMQELRSKVMQNFKQKQNLFAEKHTEILHVSEEKKEVSAPLCSLCKEPLLNSEKIFGKICYISQTTLFYQSLLSTFSAQYKENKSIEILNKIMDIKKLETNHDLKNLRILTCKHYAHIECIKRSIPTKSIVPGFFSAFLCPVCKSVSNCVIPEYDEKIKDKEIFVEMFFKLLTNISQKKLQIAENIVNFFEYNILISDIYDFKEFIENQADLLLFAIFNIKKEFESDESFITDFKKYNEKLENTKESPFKNPICYFIKWAISSFICEKSIEIFKKNLQEKLEFTIYLYLLNSELRKQSFKNEELKMSESVKISKFEKSEISLPELRKICLIYSLISNKINELCALYKQPNISNDDEFNILSSFIKFDFTKSSNLISKFSIILPKIINENPIIYNPVTEYYSILYPSILKFSLIPLPQTYPEVIEKYSPIACSACGKQCREKAVCLTCGDVFCFAEKELDYECCHYISNYHVDRCGANCSIFLSVYSGDIKICSYATATYPSVYHNKFGESLDKLHLESNNKYTLNEKSYKELGLIVKKGQLLNLLRNLLDKS